MNNSKCTKEVFNPSLQLVMVKYIILTIFLCSMIEAKNSVGLLYSDNNKINNLNNIKLNPFKIQINSALNERGFHRTTISPFRQGNILEFMSSITYINSHKVYKSIIKWQLFDEKNKPINGYFKENIVNYTGVKKNHTFKIKLGQNLQNGKYTIKLIHYLKSNPKIFKQANISFLIKQDIKILSLQIANSTKDKKNRNIFFNDEIPHLYVNLKLSKNIKKVKILLSATNQHGVELYDYEGFIKRKGKSQRTGIKISKLNAGDIVTFYALLTGEDGYTIEQSKSFMVINYPLDIIGNFNLKYNESKKFKVKVPHIFEKPFVININSNNYYKVFIGKNLYGTITAKNTSNSKLYENLIITIVDKKGRKAVNYQEIRINKKVVNKI